MKKKTKDIESESRHRPDAATIDNGMSLVNNLTSNDYEAETFLFVDLLLSTPFRVFLIHARAEGEEYFHLST